MTSAELHTENERLHALLADACDVLCGIARIGEHSEDPQVILMAAGAQVCLDRIKQG